MGSDGSLPDIDSRLVEAGFPVEELAELIEDSQQQFKEALDNYPDGDNWSEGEPRDFQDDIAWNVQDAIDAGEYNQFDTTDKHLGDTLNYVLFTKAAINNWKREALAGKNKSEVNS